MKDLKITKILLVIFILSIVLEASILYLNNPHKGIKCPKCNSSDTSVVATDEFMPEYQCYNCGAWFWENGDIIGFDKNINEKYNESLKYHESNKNQ